MRAAAPFLVCAAVASVAAAQAPPGGEVTGTITDSLGSPRPLAGAEVWLVGATATRIAVADDSGRFRLADVPVGRYRVAVFHAMLDSLGLQGPTAIVDVDPRRRARLSLATPSGRATLERVCRRMPSAGEGAALGLVADADGGGPVAGAEVVVSWVEWNVDPKRAAKSLDLYQRELRTTSDSLGQFVVCGVPTDVRIEIAANAAGDTAGPLPLALAGRSIGAVRLFLARRDAMEGTAARTGGQGGALLVGRVQRASGAPLPDATVVLDGTDVEARTDSVGRFRLDALPAGSGTLVVRAIGYAPRQLAVVLHRDRADTVVVELEAATVLGTVKVVGRPEARPALTDFEARRRLGFGRFIGPEDIARRRPFHTLDVIRGQPGFAVRYSRTAHEERVFAQVFEQWCLVDLFVDGQYVHGGSGMLDQLVPASEVRAVELYKGGSIPAEFRRTMQSCAAINVWTERVVDRDE